MLRMRKKRRDIPTILSFVMLVVLLTVNVVVDPNFFGAFSLSTFITDAVPLILVATGQFLVIVTSGIDLSVGSIMAIADTFVAAHMHGGLGSIVSITMVVLVMGAGAGFINGLAVHVGRIQPILVTLATMSIYQGVALLIMGSPGGQVPAALTNAVTGSLGLIPVALLIVVALVLVWAWAGRLRFTLHLVALGSDESAARMNGIRIGTVKVGAYILSGLFAALSGLYLAAQTTSGDPNVGVPFTLLSIAAVVIGGVRLAGGRGTLYGVVAGALILSILNGLMYFAGVSSFYQDLFEGMILIVAVGVSSYKSLRSRFLDMV